MIAVEAAEPVRVLLSNDRLGYGDERFHGSGRLMVEWTRALVRRGVDVTSVITRRPGRLGEAVLSEGLPFVFLSRGLYDLRTGGDFARLMRDRRIEVAHLQGFGAGTFGRIAARRLAIPAIHHVHADHRYEPRGYPWYVRLLDRALAPGTDRVLVVSEAVRGFAVRFQGADPTRVEVWRNPVDLARFPPITPDERTSARTALGLEPNDRVAVCVARFDPVKGVDVLLEAWPRVERAMSSARLLLLGDGPQSEDLRGRRDRLARPEAVKFLGYREDVPQVLAAADVAVLPSRSEGLPLAALESLGRGLPIVATRVGGIPEVVRDGENGRLVPGEDPTALGAALLALLADEEARTALARRARPSVEPFDLERFAERLEVLYLWLAGRGPAPPQPTPASWG